MLQSLKNKPHHWLLFFVASSFIVLMFKPKLPISVEIPGWYSEGSMPIQPLFMGFVLITCLIYRKYQFNPILNLIHVLFTIVAFGYFITQESRLIDLLDQNNLSLDKLFQKAFEIRVTGILIAIVSQIPFLVNILVLLFGGTKNEKMDTEIIDSDV